MVANGGETAKVELSIIPLFVGGTSQCFSQDAHTNSMTVVVAVGDRQAVLSFPMLKSGARKPNRHPGVMVIIGSDNFGHAE